MLELGKCPIRALILLFLAFLTLQISAFGAAIGEEGSRMGDSSIYQRIKSAVDSIRLIDTHEHQVTEELRLANHADLFFWIVQPWGFTQNTDSDLMAAGLSEEDRVFISDSKNPDSQRWARLAPYWEATKYTSYALPARIAARDIHGDYVTLRNTKNNDVRHVPLTARAKELVREFSIRPATASALFSRAVKDAKIRNLTFHDSRHEATFRLAQKIRNPMDLAKITGHKDLRILLNVYYSPTPEDLASLLK